MNKNNSTISTIFLHWGIPNLDLSTIFVYIFTNTSREKHYESANPKKSAWAPCLIAFFYPFKLY